MGSKIIFLHLVAITIHLSLSLFIAFHPSFENLRTRKHVELLVPGWEIHSNNSTFSNTTNDVLLSPCVKESALSLNLWILTEFFNSTTTIAHFLYLVSCLLSKVRPVSNSVKKRANCWQKNIAIPLVSYCSQTYPKPALEQGIFIWRWLEYSISATAMILLICVQIGARSVFVYLHAALLTILVMVTGGAIPQAFYSGEETIGHNLSIPSEGEGLMKESTKINVQRTIIVRGRFKREIRTWHILSWVLLVQSWVPIFWITRSSLQSARKDPSNEAPVGIIIAVVICEFLFFSSFGIVESLKVRLQQKKKENAQELHTLYTRTEYAYIILSITSKTLLIILTAVSLNQMPEFVDGVQCT